MANIRIVIEYEGFRAEDAILLKDSVQELLRRVNMKHGPCSVDEVTHQIVNELNTEIDDKRMLRKLVHLIVEQINQDLP